MPAVTFAVFCYNQSKFVSDAIKGALSQTYQPLDIIISDDASTDGTFEIAEEIIANYSGPHTVRLNRNASNLGIGRHVAKVFSMANGEWLVGAAGDDISLPHRSAVLMQAARRAGHGCMGVASTWLDIDYDGRRSANPSSATLWHEAQSKLKWERGLAGCYHALAEGNMLLPGCSAAWDVRLHRGWPAMNDDLVFEDVSLSCRAHLSGFMALVDEPLVKYRQSPEAVTNQCRSSDPTHEVQRRANAKRARLSRLVCYDQFMADLAYIDQQGGNEARDERLISLICASKQAEELRISWTERTLAQRLYETASGRYPFGPMRLSGWVHFVPEFLKRGLTQLRR